MHWFSCVIIAINLVSLVFVGLTVKAILETRTINKKTEAINKEIEAIRKSREANGRG